jgi:Tfp pilus assembly protein PilO
MFDTPELIFSYILGILVLYLGYKFIVKPALERRENRKEGYPSSTKKEAREKK